MSLINRIEVINTLDSDGGPRWRPDFKKATFRLLGLSSAAVMENGTGKTTIVDAILALLSRDSTLISNTKAKFPPKKSGPRGHVRVELIIPNPLTADQNSLLINHIAGTGLNTWVFGICGYRDDKHYFYCYRGKLEDASPALEEPNQTTFISNEDFRAKLKDASKSEWNVSKDAWLERINKHISRQQVIQMITFQKSGAGDESSPLFPIKRIPGQEYDATFFYQFIAPELLSGIMMVDGGTDIRFEDVVNRSANRIVAAQDNVKQDEHEISQKRLALSSMQVLLRDAAKVEEAKEKVEKANQSILNVASVVDYLKQVNLPGIPHMVSTGEPQVDALQQNMAIVPGHGVMLKDKGMKAFFKKETHHINRDFERQGFPPTSSSQHIDFYVDIKLNKPSHGGRRHPGKFYNLKDCLNFIQKSSNEYLGLLSDDTSGRENLCNILERAFSHVEKSIDTSPFRAIARDISASITISDEKITLTDKTQKQILEDITALQQELKDISRLEEAYKEIANAGLLEANETPAEATKRMSTQIESLEKDARELIALQKNHDGNKKQYDLLIETYGQNSDPEKIQAKLAKKRIEAQKISDQLAKEQAQNRIQRDANEDNLNQENSKILERQSVVEKLEKGAHAEKLILSEFSDCLAPIDVQEKIRTVRQDLETTLANLNKKLTDFKDEIESHRKKLNTKIDNTAQLLTDEKVALSKLEENLHSILNQTKDLDSRIEDSESELTVMKQELKQAGESLEKTHQREAALREQISHIEAFKKIAQNLSPEEFIENTKYELNRLMKETNQTNDSITLLQNQRDALRNETLAPEKIAQEAWTMVPHQAKNLWKVILDELPKASQQRWLDRLSAIMFAPVLKDEKEATKLALVFEEKQIPLPVFIEKPLLDALAQEDLGFVKALPVYRSQQVDYLLNPEKKKAKIKDIELQLASLKITYSELIKLTESFKEDSPNIKTANLALKALLADAPQEMVNTLASLKEHQQTIKSRNNSIEKLQLRIKKLTAAKNLKITEGQSLEKSRPDLEKNIFDLGNLITSLRNERDNLTTQFKQDYRIKLEDSLDLAQNSLTKHIKNYGSESTFAAHLSSYVKYHSEGGKKRLEQEKKALALSIDNKKEAEELKKSLLIDRNTLRDKADISLRELSEIIKQEAMFDFPALIQFHQTGGLKQYESIQGRIAKLDEEKAKLVSYKDQYNFNSAQNYINKRDRQQALSKIVSEKQVDLEQAKKTLAASEKIKKQYEDQLYKVQQEERNYDEQLAELLPLLHQAPTLDQASGKAVTDSDLFKKVSSCANAVIAACTDFSSISSEAATCLREIREHLMQSDLVDLTKKLENCVKAVGRAQSYYEQTMEHTLPSLRDKFTELEIEEIANTRNDPTKLKQKVALYETILARKEKDMNIHMDILRKEKERFIERMSTVASKAEGNLKAFRRNCNKHKDATFNVSAEIATREEIATAMERIIELAQALLKRQRDTDGKVSSKSLDAACFGSKDSDQRKISAKVLYETIFKDPHIEVKHPDIRQGQFMKFSQGDKTISKGQKAALDLMMLVRLAEFAKHKQLTSMSVGNRKRETGLHQTFILIDGLFSSLSKPSLIKGALAALDACQGQFQLIGFIHNLRYVNDFNIFPTYIVGRKVEGKSNINGEDYSESWVEIDEHSDPNYAVPNGGSKIGQVGIFNATFVPKGNELGGTA